MITVQYKDSYGWHTTQCINPACFATWVYTFTTVKRYVAHRDGKLFAVKKPKPFYVNMLQWLF